MAYDGRQRTALRKRHARAELFRHRGEGLLDGRRDVERLCRLSAQRGDVQHVSQEPEDPVDPAIDRVLMG
ncbi:hypothetical protein BE04_34970 [Sorangium cellulosum]|uniref:Uncharacterized protein n=2 Tax=Sorangium cellulosum TaxID=56 RepID=A0A150P725_SORCE|nr:hypothetical protein SCE1572_13440 [Sorangium cellulosum So0157-2]KYF51473.1 hypothetical protein BE04_34970 [Sorangium cellulosum]